MARGTLAAAAAWLGGAAWAADDLVTTDQLLKDPKFKAAYVSALGPRAKTPWLARMSNSAPVRPVTVAGGTYQLATPCKPHDCADNNLLLLYAATSGRVVGRLFEAGRPSHIGSPDPAMAAALDKLWRQEFRQQP